MLRRVTTKPLKYPHMFRAVGLVVINKLDLAPHLGFDEAACRANIAAVNPKAKIIGVSARTGGNLGAGTDLLRSLLAEANARI